MFLSTLVILYISYDSTKCLCCFCYRSNAMPQPLSTCPESDASSSEKTSLALVAVPPMNVEPLAMVPPCMQ